MHQRGGLPGALALLLLAMAAVGCATSGELATQRAIIGEQIHEIDSLRATQRRLVSELAVLRDSLQFIDDIETGQYYRDMRVLEDRILRLEFVLHQQESGITIAELPADALFAPASAELTSAGRSLLDSVAVVLANSFADHVVRVEGHADTSPLGPSLIERYGSNWGLSSARAASVVTYLGENYDFDEARLTAVGYGSARPVASNDTPAGRRQNRRVRVSATPSYDRGEAVSEDSSAE